MKKESLSFKHLGICLIMLIVASFVILYGPEVDVYAKTCDNIFIKIFLLLIYLNVLYPIAGCIMFGGVPYCVGFPLVKFYELVEAHQLKKYGHLLCNRKKSFTEILPNFVVGLLLFSWSIGGLVWMFFSAVILFGGPQEGGFFTKLPDIMRLIAG